MNRWVFRAAAAWRQLVLAAAYLLIAGGASAAPGAHGPDGEHLDAKSGTVGAGNQPRAAAASELFELVAELKAGELVVLIDRFETNEPVLGARLDIAAGALKAVAAFRGDRGDYVVAEPALLKQLATPGEHALVFTVMAGNDADLLDATWIVPAHSHDHDHDHTVEYLVWGGGLVMALGALAVLAVTWRSRLRRRRALRGLAPSLALAIALSIAALLPLSVAAPGAHGPDGQHLDAPGTISASGLARLPDGSVNVPKSAQRRMGIRTQLVPESDAAGTVELPGTVTIDPNAGGRVQSVHGGRIEPGPGGLPVAGQAVRRGQVLAWVRHHAEPFAVSQQQAQLADLRAQRQLAEQRVARLESLSDTVPRKEIEAARADMQGLRERESSIAAGLGRREALVAPVSGVIARADAVAGQVVEARDVVFEVVDPARVLVEAVTADATLPARIAGARVQGVADAQLRLLGAARSLRDGVLPLSFSARAGKGGAALPLAVGQPVTVIVALNERIKGFVLPAQAVVRSPANEPIVWIKSGAERFIPQPVAFRPLDAQTVVVTAGLGADNRVVVQGAPLIAQIR